MTLKDIKINVFYSKDDEGWIAEIEGERFSTFGEIPEHAFNELMQIVRDYLDEVNKLNANRHFHNYK